MYIESLELNKKNDILILDEIGEVIEKYISLDSISRKSKFNHYEFSQINQDDKYLLKYVFFYKDFIREFLVDDYHIVEIKGNKIKHDEVLNAKYNLFMCKQMNKCLGDNSYFDDLLQNLNDKETKTFDKTLKMHAELIDIFEYYGSQNNWEK